MRIDGQIYTVRYIGIDTPETVHPSKPVEWMGVEASAANAEFVEGKMVYLETDVSETDRYGRLLRYIYLADGLFVNAELVRLGYAHASTYPPDVRYQELFIEAQGDAQLAQAGLWQPSTSTPTATSSPIPGATSPPAVCDCSGNVYNCSDFSTHNQAQDCFDYCVGQGRGDVHILDRDNNGVACESLP